MNMSTKQLQDKLLASLDEKEEMETRIEDLGKSGTLPCHMHILCSAMVPYLC